jgi:hypothetical protein
LAAGALVAFSAEASAERGVKLLRHSPGMRQALGGTCPAERHALIVVRSCS